MAKIALVTGSTNNIGKSIAEVLSRDGYHVIITSRNETEAREVAENLPQPGSYFRLDYAKAEEIKALFDFIKEKFGRLDVLVNNVAYTKNESILDCDLETWQLTMDTNLRSYYLCSRYAAFLMKEQRGRQHRQYHDRQHAGAQEQVFLRRKQRRNSHALTLSSAR